MRNASVEWMARVAARNAIETAKALRAGTPASTRMVPLSAGTRTAPVGETPTVRNREVAK